LLDPFAHGGGLAAPRVLERLSRLSKQKRRVAVGLRGNVIAPYDLPPAHGARWTPQRKADLIAAILGGVITLDEAKARYALTIEELSEWRRGLAAAGVRGLKATKRIGTRKELATASEEQSRNP
jgi:hypothetical protein